MHQLQMLAAGRNIRVAGNMAGVYAHAAQGLTEMLSLNYWDLVSKCCLLIMNLFEMLSLLIMNSLKYRS